MQITIINTLYAPYIVGGAERSVQFLAESLVQHNHDVIVICASPNSGIRQDTINGVRVYYVGLKNLYWPFDNHDAGKHLKPFWHTADVYNPWMAGEVAKILDIEKPDIVHTNNLAGFSTAVWHKVKARNIPLVHTLRDHYLLCPRSTMFRNGENCQVQCWQCRSYSVTKKASSRLVDTVIGISRFIIDKHLKFGYFSNVKAKRVIYNSYMPETTSPARKALLGAPLRIGYLGRLSPEKGIKLLLKGITQIPSPGWQLLIGGQGHEQYESNLRNLYSSKDIHFLGFIKPEEFFTNIDILVVPSLLHESMGRTVIEAYAHGIPVIGSNRGGIPEIIEEGKTGAIFDPDVPGSLCNKIEHYRQHPAELTTMRLYCLEKARAFAPEKIVTQYLSAYQDALAARA